MIPIIINKKCYIAKFSIHDKGKIILFISELAGIWQMYNVRNKADSYGTEMNTLS